MDELISKTQKKREATQMQDLGVALIDLKAASLEKLPLSPLMKSALHAAKSITSHRAMKRQAQYIGKLMRKEDFEAIQTAYHQLKVESDGQTLFFHRLERWRDRLIHEDNEALTAFIEEYPQIDTKQLRHLIKKAKVALDLGQKTAATRVLFRFLRDNA